MKGTRMQSKTKQTPPKLRASGRQTHTASAEGAPRSLLLAAVPALLDVGDGVRQQLDAAGRLVRIIARSAVEPVLRDPVASPEALPVVLLVQPGHRSVPE